MRRTALLITILLTTSVSAETTIGFHVVLTDARTALRANPQFHELKLTEEQVERAAKDRVLMLDRTIGTRWTWLMLSWPENRPVVEHGLNVAGGAVVGKNADVGLKPIDERTLEVRCLREQCVVTVDEKSVTLAKDQAGKVPFGSDVRIAF